MKDKNIEIRYVQKDDHHKLGIVDRWIRTFREKTKYVYGYAPYIKFIDEFKYNVDEYNDTYHSTIKKAPRDVNNKDEHK